jgi:hypothetical protein
MVHLQDQDPASVLEVQSQELNSFDQRNLVRIVIAAWKAGQKKARVSMRRMPTRRCWWRVPAAEKLEKMFEVVQGVGCRASVDRHRY